MRVNGGVDVAILRNTDVAYSASIRQELLPFLVMYDTFQDLTVYNELELQMIDVKELKNTAPDAPERLLEVVA